MDKDKLHNELEKLRKSERHYRILMDESMDPTFSFYADGTYRYVNIEGYIQRHSEAQFSHGICPDCAKKIYPDLDI